MSALNQIDTLITKIDNNMSQSESKNNDESKQSENITSILGLGNPLLDISSPVNADFMKKYDIKPNNAILAEKSHIPMYTELSNMDTVEYIGGGSTLNSMRVCSWMLQQQNSAGYMGCIGVDKFVQILESTTQSANVDCYFMKDNTTATGTCAVCITDKERSLGMFTLKYNNYFHSKI